MNPTPFRFLGAFCLTAVLALGATAPTQQYPVQNFGAKGDGQTLDTAALQRAIETAHEKGGGVVVLPAGRYLSGTIHLLSNVTLRLERGAVLLGSPSLADYRRGYWPALVLARGQENIAIEGEGEIDGQGKRVAADSVRIYESGKHVDFFPGLKPGEKVFTGIGTDRDPWIDPYAMQAAGTLAARVAPRDREDVATWRVDEFVRPQLVEFWECRQARVEGILLRDAANWVQTYRECDDLQLLRVRVRSVTYWNNDGMDIVNCRRVHVADCDIDAADDGICLKTHRSADNRPCEDIVIERCRIRSSASALKFGTASYTPFRRVRAEHLEIYDTYRSAVALEAVDGGTIEDITVRHLRARNTGNAFFLCIGQRNGRVPPGYLRRVEFSDFVVEVPAGKPDTGYAHEGPMPKVPMNVAPAVIVGLPERAVEDVVLKDVTIRYGGGARRERAEVGWTDFKAIPERRENYPEFSMFGELPAWGLFLRHATGIRLENVELSLAQGDYRPALTADRVPALTFATVKVVGATGAPVFVLNQSAVRGLPTVDWPTGAGEHVLELPAASTAR